MSTQKNNKLYKVKAHFDKYTSQNATNWKLVLFWIIIIELLASIFEYLFIGSPVTLLENKIPNNMWSQFIVGLAITGYVWTCVYNFIFWNKTIFLYLILLGTFGLYVTITHDLYFDFLLTNINPLHLASIDFGFAFMIELFFKLLMTYLLYQLVMSYKNRNIS